MHGNPIDQSDDIQAWLMHGPWDEKSNEKQTQADTNTEIRSISILVSSDFLVETSSTLGQLQPNFDGAQIARKS